MATFNLDWQVDTSQIDRLVQQLQSTRDRAEAAASALDGVQTNVKKATAATHEFSLANAGVVRELSVMFGEAMRGNWTRLEGSMTVLANRTGLLATLFTPLGALIGATAGAVGLLALAAHQGAEEQQKLSTALVMSGNAAGSSAGALIDLSRAAGEASGNLSGAKEAMEKLAESGRFTQGEMQGISAAASGMARDTGQSVDKIVAHFVRLADEPVKGSIELNKQYHYLTAATLDHIDALMREGRAQEAAGAALAAYTDAMNQRHKEIVENLSIWQRMANATGQAFTSMWQAISGIGRQDTFDEQLKSAQGAVDALQKKVDGGHADAYTQKRLDAAKENLATIQAAMHDAQMSASRDADRQAAQDGKTNASAWWNAHHKEFLTRAQQEKEFEAEIRREGLAAGKSEDEINQAIANSHSRHPGKKPKAPNQSDNNAAIEAIRGDITQKRALYDVEVTDLQTALAKQQITQEQFDQQKLAAQVKMLQGDMDDALQAKKIAESKGSNYKAEAQKWQNDYDKFAADMRLAQAQYEKSEADHAKKLQKIWTDLSASEDKYTSQRLLSMRKQTNQQFMTSNQRSVSDMHDEVNTHFDSDAESLHTKFQQGTIDAKTLADDLDKLESKRKDALDAVDSEWQKRLDAQHDWTNGAKLAFAEYADAAANAADQTKNLFANAFRGMEDMLVNFAMTGKFNFADFAKNVIADIFRMEIKAEEAKALQWIMGAMGLGGGGGAVNLGTVTGDAMDAMTMSAHGGVYPSGFFASGTVVNGPRFFAGGAGLMGEQNPEAIMPLTRGADGKLGVVAAGSGGGVQVHGGINVTVQGGMTNEDTGKVVALAVSESLKHMPAVADSRIHNAQRYGGLSYGR